MRYRIQIKAIDRGDNSLYRYYKKDDTVFETNSIEALDSEVETLLQEYKKDELDIIAYGVYDILADITEDSFKD